MFSPFSMFVFNFRLMFAFDYCCAHGLLCLLLIIAVFLCVGTNSFRFSFCLALLSQPSFRFSFSFCLVLT